MRVLIPIALFGWLSVFGSLGSLTILPQPESGWVPTFLRAQNEITLSGQVESPAFTPQRVAMVGITGDAGAEAAASIAKSLSSNPSVQMLDADQIQAAVTGVGYKGSTNMDTSEASSLGSAIGCDFFIIGKAESLSRSESVGELHGEAYAAVMIVDGRSGALAYFDYTHSSAPTSEAAKASMNSLLSSTGQKYANAMLHFRERLLADIPGAVNVGPIVEEMPEDGSPESAGFTPPKFLNKTKPDYTSQADLAGVSATVEARAEFLADGTIGKVRIVKWAGFGLDESAEAAIRALKFKPATRDGKAVGVRALVRYNFRQVPVRQAAPVK